MLYVDTQGKLHTIGQFGATTVVSLTASTAQTVSLDANSIYRITCLNDIYVVQGTSSSITATTDDALIIAEHEEFFNTFNSYNYISLISDVATSVYITKMA